MEVWLMHNAGSGSQSMSEKHTATEKASNSMTNTASKHHCEREETVFYSWLQHPI